MKATERQKRIIELLTASKTPISGDKFSDMLKASRQIIVHDVAMLRLAGYDIIPTHRGYVLGATPLVEREFKTWHKNEETADELLTIIDNGGTVLNVHIDHDVYGKISADLNLFSASDVQEFSRRIKNSESKGLMSLTSGCHYHTVRAESNKVLDKIEKALKEKGYLVD